MIEQIGGPADVSENGPGEPVPDVELVQGCAGSYTFAEDDCARIAAAAELAGEAAACADDDVSVIADVLGLAAERAFNVRQILGGVDESPVDPAALLDAGADELRAELSYGHGAGISSDCAAFMQDDPDSFVPCTEQELPNESSLRPCR